MPQKLKSPVRRIPEHWRRNNNLTLFRGDCAALLSKIPSRSVDLVLTSPPYCIGKSYERKTRAADFLPQLQAILPELLRVIRIGGSLCWQVGYHVDKGIITPLDSLIYQMMSGHPSLHLRNRIVWMFGHGLHAEDRFSGRHETILWFTKGKRYRFNLDAVRVLQKYPGKKHYKGDRKGTLSGNPNGKNPSDVWSAPDVWDIPNVKANHVEKTKHPCQFPVALAQRLIMALTRRGDLVLDPFSGAGTTGCACTLTGRRFVGSEISKRYHKIAAKRMLAAARGDLQYRASHRPIYEPKAGTPLTTIPTTWRVATPNNNGAAPLS